MAPIERQKMTPEGVSREIESTARLFRENKYAFQIGLKDVDFEVNDELVQSLGLRLPFRTIDQAEAGLRCGAITPREFIEEDQTQHCVLAFEPRPVGFSGFLNCVTHSLALTDRGLFEVGRYAAVNMSETGRAWQWFIHRRLAAPDELANMRDAETQSPEDILERVYRALTDSI